VNLARIFRRRTYRSALALLSGAIRSIRLRFVQFDSGIGDSAWMLYSLTRALKPEVCVEIGSARGKSTCYVGLALEENQKGRLFAIDPHTLTKWNDQDAVDTYEVLRKNLASFGVGHRVEIIREYSHEAAGHWRTPIDLLFIDGDHSYEGVKRDWQLFTPHLREFGVVVFHDTIWEVGKVDEQYRRQDMGVPGFVDELRREGYPVITLPNDCGMSIVQPVRNGIALTKR
jgi:predicted O-methyltransferase YrrM